MTRDNEVDANKRGCAHLHVSILNVMTWLPIQNQKPGKSRRNTRALPTVRGAEG